jgi:hypothetical protein
VHAKIHAELNAQKTTAEVNAKNYTKVNAQEKLLR